APHHLRYHDVPAEPISDKMLKKLKRDVLAICKALGYDMNTVELAVRDGVPYAIDLMNPAPDADYNSVGRENFEWVVKTVGKMLVDKAVKNTGKPSDFSANGMLEPGA